MKFLALFLPAAIVSYSDAVALEKRERDCGVWRFDCANAAGACNNACYYHYCEPGGEPVYVAHSGAKATTDHNREQAGTKTGGQAVCRAYPIAQLHYDQLPYHPTDDLQTDEWPMAAMLQLDFQEGSGIVRNQLRCIPADENQSGGIQISNFLNGYGDWGENGIWRHERTCARPKERLRQGDKFKVQFILDGDGSATPYCKPNRDCRNDGRQFYMTKHNEAGLQYPYNFDTMNHYRLSGAENDLRMLRVHVVMTGENGKNVRATMCSNVRIQDTCIPTGNAVQGTLGVGETIKIPTAPFGGGTVGITRTEDRWENVVEFNYNECGDSAYFAWKSNDEGRYDGRVDADYCIDTTQGEGDEKMRIISCGFPAW